MPAGPGPGQAPGWCFGQLGDRDLGAALALRRAARALSPLDAAASARGAAAGGGCERPECYTSGRSSRRSRAGRLDGWRIRSMTVDGETETEGRMTTTLRIMAPWEGLPTLFYSDCPTVAFTKLPEARTPAADRRPSSPPVPGSAQARRIAFLGQPLMWPQSRDRRRRSNCARRLRRSQDLTPTTVPAASTRVNQFINRHRFQSTKVAFAIIQAFIIILNHN